MGFYFSTRPTEEELVWVVHNPLTKFICIACWLADCAMRETHLEISIQLLDWQPVWGTYSERHGVLPAEDLPAPFLAKE